MIGVELSLIGRASLYIKIYLVLCWDFRAFSFLVFCRSWVASLGRSRLLDHFRFALRHTTPLRVFLVHLNSFPGPVSWEYRWCRTEWIEFRSRPFASSWCSWTTVVFMSCVVLLNPSLCLSTGRGMFPLLDKCFQLFTYKLFCGWRILKRRLKFWHLIPSDDWLCLIAVWLPWQSH